MTRKQYKRLTKLIGALILLAILIGLMTGCGVNYNLRRRDYHERKAIALGAIVKADTLWKTMEVLVPELKTDTVLKSVSFKDTITVSKDRIVTRIKYDTINRTLFISTDCPPDTIRIKVPVTVNKVIKSPRGFWYYFQYIAIALIVGFILGAIFWASVRAWIKSLL